MTGHDRLVRMIPWYVTGTLPEDERRLVERHLAGCEECRQRVDLARAQREWLTTPGRSEGMEHVHPSLLVDYAESPEQLDPDVRTWIEERLVECDQCRSAFERLREIDPVRESSVTVMQFPPHESRGVVARMWDLMSNTVLRPVPALAYLVLLAVGMSVLWTGRGGSDVEPPMVAVGKVVVGPERRDRDGDQDARRTAVPVEIDSRSESVVVLDLNTGLVPEEVAVLGDRVRVRVERAGIEIVDRELPVTKLEPSSGGARLGLALRFRPEDDGVIYRVTLRAIRPGDPLDDRIVFDRDLRPVAVEVQP